MRGALRVDGGTVMADYRLDTEHSTRVRECGCETTYKGAVPVYEKVCAMHKSMKTCLVCFAVVWNRHMSAHLDWHAETGQNLTHAVGSPYRDRQGEVQGNTN